MLVAPRIVFAKITAGLALSAVFVFAPQSRPPTSIWQRITYPPVPLPGAEREQLSFLVGSGGHTGSPQEEPSHLRLDVMWSGRDGTPRPAPIADRGSVTVKLHTADGKVAAPNSPVDWIGVGNAGWTTWQVNNIFPWSRNALDEAWFEVRIGSQIWWVELPYGFARNPEDTEVPDATRGVPQFPPAMRQLGENDILVPWLSVTYELGRTQDGAILTLNLGNPFDARATARVYREPPMRVGPDTSRMSLDSPRIAVSIETSGRQRPGHDLSRELDEDRHNRTDVFTFDRDPARGRTFGTVTVTVDGPSYSVRVPSSLFAYTHGRTDPENKKWLRSTPAGR
jgi:hypothetical protein